MFQRTSDSGPVFFFCFFSVLEAFPVWLLGGREHFAAGAPGGNGYLTMGSRHHGGIHEDLRASW